MRDLHLSHLCYFVRLCHVGKITYRYLCNVITKDKIGVEDHCVFVIFYSDMMLLDDYKYVIRYSV